LDWLVVLELQHRLLMNVQIYDTSPEKISGPLFQFIDASIFLPSKLKTEDGSFVPLNFNI
jgi:hypothetical protein